MVAKRSIFAKILSVFSTNLFIIGLTAVSGILLPRLLNPMALGRLNAYLALAAIIYSITFLGMRSSLVMHLGKRKFSSDSVLIALRYIFLLSTLLSTLTLVVFFFTVSKDQYHADIILLVCLINPFAFIISYMQGYNLAKERIERFNRLKWLPALMNLSGILVFVGLLRLHVKGALLATILSNLITIFLYLKITQLKLPSFHRGKIPVKVIKSLIGFGSMYALAFMATRLNHRIDILLMKRLSNLSEVGYYSLGANVAEILWQIPIAVGIILMTRTASQKDQDKSTAEVCSSLRVSVLIVLAAALLLYLLAPWLVSLLFGERYLPSVPVIRAILPGILFFVILKILNSQFIGSGKPQLTLPALIPSLILNIILNLYFIPAYQGLGAAIATDISYFTASFILLLIYSRVFGIPMARIFRYQKQDFAFLRKIRLRKNLHI